MKVLTLHAVSAGERAGCDSIAKGRKSHDNGLFPERTPDFSGETRRGHGRRNCPKTRQSTRRKSRSGSRRWDTGRSLRGPGPGSTRTARRGRDLGPPQGRQAAIRRQHRLYQHHPPRTNTKPLVGQVFGAGITSLHGKYPSRALLSGTRSTPV